MSQSPRSTSPPAEAGSGPPLPSYNPAENPITIPTSMPPMEEIQAMFNRIPRPPNPLPVVKLEPKITTHDVLGRIKWNVLELPLEALVLDINPQGESHWHPLFEDSDISTKATEEPATEPPRARLCIRLQDVHFWYKFDNCREKRPKPLIIHNEDEKPVSVSQFMHEVHMYALSLRDLMCECADIDLYDWPHARFYIDGVQGTLENTLERVEPELYVWTRETIPETEEELIAKHLLDIEYFYWKARGLE